MSFWKISNWCSEAKRLGQYNTEFCCVRAGSDGWADRTDWLILPGVSSSILDGCWCSLMQGASAACLTQHWHNSAVRKAHRSTDLPQRVTTNEWRSAWRIQQGRYSRSLSLSLCCLTSSWKTWRSAKGNPCWVCRWHEIEGTSGRTEIQGHLDRLQGCATGNLHSSARKGCAPGKEESTEKIKAGEETAQGTPLWKRLQKSWNLGRSLGKAPLLHYTYTYYFFLPRDWECSPGIGIWIRDWILP